jgi:hypothetical protein
VQTDGQRQVQSDNAACVVTLVDRLIHRAEVVEIDAESYRLKDCRTPQPLQFGAPCPDFGGSVGVVAACDERRDSSRRAGERLPLQRLRNSTQPESGSAARRSTDALRSPVNVTTPAAFFTGEVRLFTGGLHRIPALPDDRQHSLLPRLPEPSFEGSKARLVRSIGRLSTRNEGTTFATSRRSERRLSTTSGRRQAHDGLREPDQSVDSSEPYIQSARTPPRSTSTTMSKENPGTACAPAETFFKPAYRLGCHQRSPQLGIS